MPAISSYVEIRRVGGRHDVRKRRVGAASSSVGDESEEGIELEARRGTNTEQTAERALYSPMKCKVSIIGGIIRHW